MIHTNIKTSNLDLPDSVTNGVQCLRFKEWLIIVNGECVDVAYGNEDQAWLIYDEVKKELAENGTPDMGTDWNELIEDDTYWKNGSCPRLRIDGGIDYERIYRQAQQHFGDMESVDDEQLNEWLKWVLSDYPDINTDEVIAMFGNSWAGQ